MKIRNFFTDGLATLAAAFGCCACAVAVADSGLQFSDKAGSADIDIRMVVVDAGNFQMGSPDNEPGRADREGPQSSISIGQPFAVSTTEITVGQFAAFVEATGYVTDAEKAGSADVFNKRNGKMDQEPDVNWRHDFLGEDADPGLPVIRVSWNDVNAFVEWLSKETGQAYRLPSEAEFEYAMRAGSTSRYWWGDASPPARLENLAGSRERIGNLRWPVAFRNYSDSFWGPAPVGSFQPNPFGLYDMGGNIAEWVADCYVESIPAKPSDGKASSDGNCDLRVFRGAAWSYAPPLSRSAYRNAAKPSSTLTTLGFRVARDVNAETLSQARQ